MILSNHAKKQLRERNISEELVRKALSVPDEIIPTNEGRKVIHFHIQEDEKVYLLRIIAEQTGSDWLVITVYKTSKIDKYWRGEPNES